MLLKDLGLGNLLHNYSFKSALNIVIHVIGCIIQLFGHCIATWYSMFQSLVNPTETGTSLEHG